MKYNRVIAFGCSNTYGYGLQDCYEGKNKKEPGLYASSYAWPSILSGLLNLNIINMSSPGASNKEIWHEIVNFEFEPTDLVFTMWTGFYRWCTLASDNLSRIGTWTKGKKTKAYFRYFYDENDQNIDTNLRMSHVDYHLHRLGIKNFQLTYNQRDFVPCDFTKDDIVLPLFFRFYEQTYPLAYDKNHAGELAHRVFAENLYEHIKDEL